MANLNSILLSKKEQYVKHSFLILLMMIISSCTETEESSIEEQFNVTILDFSSEIMENPNPNTTIGTVEYESVTNELEFSLIEEEPIGALKINTTNASLSVLDPNLFDYEVNPIIKAKINVSDGVNSKTASINIQLLDEFEPFFNVTNFSKTVEENLAIDTEIGKVVAESNLGDLSFTLVSSNPEGALIINSETGVLNVANKELYNYELYPEIIAQIEVSNTKEVKTIEVNIDLENLPESGTKKLIYDGVEYPLDALTMDVANRTTAYYKHTFWNFTLSSLEVTRADGTNLSGIGQFMSFELVGLLKDAIDKETIYSGIETKPDNNYVRKKMHLALDHNFTQNPWDLDFTKYLRDGTARLTRVLKNDSIYTFELDFVFELNDGTKLYGTYHGEGEDLSI